MSRRSFPSSPLVSLALALVVATTACTAPAAPSPQPAPTRVATVAGTTQPAPAPASQAPAATTRAAATQGGGSVGTAMSCRLLKESEVTELIGALAPVPSPRRVAIPHAGGVLVDSCEYLAPTRGLVVTYSVWTFAALPDLAPLIQQDAASYAAAGLKPMPSAIGNASAGAYQTVGQFTGTQVSVADGSWYLVVTVGGPQLDDALEVTRDIAALVANQGG